MYLPGHTVKCGDGYTCEGWNCECSNPATYRIQGETDSFGCEYIYLCDGCKKIMDTPDPDTVPESTICDWCKKEVTVWSHMRDFDEGTSGPVYHVCSACRAKENRRAEEELAFLQSTDW